MMNGRLSIPQLAILISSIVVAFIIGAILSPFHSGRGDRLKSEEAKEETAVAKRRIPGVESSRSEEEVFEEVDEEAERESFGSRIREALNQTDPSEQQIMLIQNFVDLDPSNLSAATAAIEELPEGVSKTIASMILMRFWAGFDPLGALDYSLNQVGGRSGKIAAVEALRVWAANDPYAALAWSKEHDRREGAFSMEAAVILGWATNNITEAATYATSLPEGPRRTLAIQRIASQYMTQGTDAMKDWIASLQDPDNKEVAMATIARNWGRLAPEKTADWLGEYIEADFAAKAVSILVDRWTLDNPRAAADWLATLPDGRSREEGTVALLDRWFEADPDSVGDYLNDQPSSPFLDQAVDKYARSAAEDDPEAAITWSESILDPEMRRASLIEVGQKWARVDSEAVRVWMVDKEIPPDIQEAIWNPAPRKEQKLRKWLERRIRSP